MNVELENKLIDLRRVFAGMSSAAIAFSGGVDSAVLAYVAQEVLEGRAVAMTADSPSLPRRELEEAKQIAERIGIKHMVFETQELEDAHYASNPSNRCYFCKAETFAKLVKLANENGFETICYGENLDDQGDFRPGAQAANEFHVRAPLKEANLYKEDIRNLARAFGLPNWDKPAAACLASRFPYGKPITREGLAQVEKAEDLLWNMGLMACRVRHHDEIARIEVPVEEMPVVLANRTQIVKGLEAVGYRFVTLDLAGYQRGVFNPPLVELDSIETAL